MLLGAVDGTRESVFFRFLVHGLIQQIACCANRFALHELLSVFDKFRRDVCGVLDERRQVRVSADVFAYRCSGKKVLPSLLPRRTAAVTVELELEAVRFGPIDVPLGECDYSHMRLPFGTGLIIADRYVSRIGR
jgi:hypothetical protein